MLTPSQPLIVYYGNPIEASAFSPYELLVFNADNHPELSELKPQQIALAYLSLGEARPEQVDALRKQHPEMLIREHPVWKSYLVDVRHPHWHQFIVEQEAPRLLAKGFNGLMFDTIDSPIHLEASEPEQYKGASNAALQIIKAIRSNHPEAVLMLNRGFELWAEAAPHVDNLLAESILTDYDFDKNQSLLRDASVYKQQLAKMQHITQHFDHIRLYTLDYWDLNDQEGLSLLYHTQKKNGLRPLISTPSLDRVPPKPSSCLSMIARHDCLTLEGYDA